MRRLKKKLGYSDGGNVDYDYKTDPLVEEARRRVTNPNIPGGSILPANHQEIAMHDALQKQGEAQKNQQMFDAMKEILRKKRGY